MEEAADSEASDLQGSKSKKMMLQDTPEGTGTPMVKAGGPMNSYLSGSSNACVGTADMVGVEQDLESYAYKKQDIEPHADMPLVELQNQHVEGCDKYASGLQEHNSYTPQVMEKLTTEPVVAYQGGVAQLHKSQTKQLLRDIFVPRKYAELVLAKKNSEIEALKKQLIQSESDLNLMQVQNSLLTQELQNVKKRQRQSKEETNHMLQEEFSVMVERCKSANCSNWLCDLPNELLVHILSFLEVKDAAQTSLSCKRLGQLWALVPDLHLGESDSSKRPLFLDFVERTIALRGRSPVREFSLNCDVEGVVVRIKKLIESVITCGVRDLSLFFSNYKRAYKLPSSIFTCESLEMLCVDSLCVLKLPSVRLPKLKVLILQKVMFEDNETLEKLFSTPSLERLDYTEGWYGIIKSSSCARPCIRVTAPKLQHLSLNMFKRSRSIIEIIGSPLKSFHYQGWFVDTDCILEDPNQLIDAFLWSGEDIYWGDRESHHAFKLLQIFSNVKEFTLSNSLLHVDPRGGNVPLFRNLIKLTLDWSLLISIRGIWAILIRSPRLQNLCFNKEYYYTEHAWDDELWHPVPECFLTELRTVSFTVSWSGELRRKLFMIRIFLEKAMALTEMVFKVPQLYDCEGFLKELRKLPVGSKNCRIFFEQMP